MRQILTPIAVFALVQLSAGCSVPTKYERDIQRNLEANAKTEKEAEALKAKIDQQREGIRTQAKNAPLKTTATLVRGDKTETIDFSSPASVSKLKDYDVVNLDEGRYEDFGAIKAYGVRLVGKGQDKTFVASKKGSLIQVNGTDFWDLTIIDSSFKSDSYVGIWATHCNLVGDIGEDASTNAKAQPIPLAVGSVWSNITMAKFAQNMTHQHLFSFNRSNDPKYETSFDNFVGVPTSAHQSAADWKAFQNIRSGMSSDLFDSRGKSFFGKRLSKSLEESWGNFIPELEKRTERDVPTLMKFRFRALYIRAMSYAGIRGLFKPNINEQAFKSEMDKAAKANKRGLPLVALLHWERANRAAAYTKLSEIESLAGPVANKIKAQSGCHLHAPGGSAAHSFMQYASKDLLKRYAVLGYGLGRNCRVTFGGTAQSEAPVKSAATAVGDAGSIEVETEESKKRRRDAEMQKAAIENAAARASQRASQAKWDASVESMKGTAKKMEEGRLKVETVGDQKIMTYGSGNWAGKPSEATTQELNKNSAEADRLRQQAAKTGTPGAQTRTVKLSMMQTVETTRTNYNIWMDTEYSGKKSRVELPQVSSTSKLVCKTQERYGALINKPVKGEGCTLSSDFETVAGKQIQARLTPKIEQLNKNAISAQTVRGERLAKSSDADEQLEAALLIQFFGSKAKTAPVSELSLKVLGEAQSAENLFMAALAF